jgi:hypothetical protein
MRKAPAGKGRDLKDFGRALVEAASAANISRNFVAGKEK